MAGPVDNLLFKPNQELGHLVWFFFLDCINCFIDRFYFGRRIVLLLVVSHPELAGEGWSIKPINK